MSRITLVVGNGLSLDRANQGNPGISPSYPLDWPVRHPTEPGLLIEALPALREFVAGQRAHGTSNDYEVIASVSSASKGKAGPWDWSNSRDFDIHSELRHYLQLAYSWYQLSIDETDLTRWAWHLWFREYGQRVCAAMSFNYDLVLERLLYWNRMPFFYPTLDGEVIRFGPAGRRQVPLPLFKPHGSCNFGSQLELSPIGYPLPTHTWAANAPLRILKDSELLQPRSFADIVIPGEWSVFGKHLDWINTGIRTFRSHASASDTLLVIGFSHGECDRTEFDQYFRMLPRFARAIVADPKPSPSLCSFLESRASRIDIWGSGPKDL